MSMLSAQRDRLRAIADRLFNMDCHDYASEVRDAADTIWELRNKMCDMVDAREQVRVLDAENAKLRELCEDMHEWMERVMYDGSARRCEYELIVSRMQELGIEVES